MTGEKGGLGEDSPLNGPIVYFTVLVFRLLISEIEIPAHILLVEMFFIYFYYMTKLWYISRHC
jgi:hypothetical protein